MTGLNAGDMYALVAAVAALVVAAIFSAARTALSRMSLVRALKLRESGRRGAEPVVALMHSPVRTLNSLALLVLLLQVTGTALLTVVVGRYTDGWVAVVASTLVAAGLLFVLAEVAPRTLALQRTDTVAVVTAPAVRLFTFPLAPLASLLVRIGDLIAPGKRLPGGPFITEEDLREMIDVAESDDVIEAGERAMLHRVFKFGDTIVREIMVPRPDMISVSADAPLRDVLGVMLAHGHSRIPVYEEDHDRIIGLIYAKDVLRRLSERGGYDGNWLNMLRPAHFVPELASVDQLLADLQAAKVHLAIVVDEYGGTAGLVTIEDILEEIVGEIVDEYDREENLVQPLGDDMWRIDARLSVDQLNELLDTSFPDDEWDSLAGLFIGTLGRVPAPGEQLEVPPVRLTAERLKGRRIVRVLVERHATADGQAVRGSA